MRTLLIALIGILAVFGNISARSLENDPELKSVEYEQRVFEGKINKSINDAVEKLKPFDPIDMQHLEFNLLGHHILITDWILAGFSNIIASRISLGGFITWTLDLEIVIGKIHEIGYWKVDGDIFYVDGDFKFDWNNAKIAIVVTLNPFSMSVKSAKITPHIDGAKTILKGIYHNEELSEKLSNWADWFLNVYVSSDKQFHEWLSKVFYEFLKKVVG